MFGASVYGALAITNEDMWEKWNLKKNVKTKMCSAVSSVMLLRKNIPSTLPVVKIFCSPKDDWPWEKSDARLLLISFA